MIFTKCFAVCDGCRTQVLVVNDDDTLDLAGWRKRRNGETFCSNSLCAMVAAQRDGAP